MDVYPLRPLWYMLLMLNGQNELKICSLFLTVVIYILFKIDYWHYSWLFCFFFCWVHNNLRNRIKIIGILIWFQNIGLCGFDTKFIFRCLQIQQFLLVTAFLQYFAVDVLIKYLHSFRFLLHRINNFKNIPYRRIAFSGFCIEPRCGLELGKFVIFT